MQNNFLVMSVALFKSRVFTGGVRVLLRSGLKLIFVLGIFLTGAFSSDSFAESKFDFIPPKALEADEAVKKSLVPENSNKNEEVTRPAVTYSGQGLRDPFKPLITKEKEEDTKKNIQKEVPKETRPLPEMKVQGLLWGGVFPQAIINNKVVKAGDMIGEVKVAEISKEGVTVIFSNMEYKLSSPAVTGQQHKVKT
ncbi:MAG: hypothetical protein PHY88_03275 [Candidatus Omnitrophica bacterium]|nr:hypothetical protein [Candidatus Omnitrophota bacterium]